MIMALLCTLMQSSLQLIIVCLTDVHFIYVKKSLRIRSKLALAKKQNLTMLLWHTC